LATNYFVQICPGGSIPDSPETGHELPVLLKYRYQKQNSLSSDIEQPSDEPASDKTVDEHWLELRTTNRRQSLSFPLLGAADVEEIVSHLSVATSATPLDTASGDLPFFAYRARLFSYGDSQSFRLVTDVQWKNSLVIPSNFKNKSEAAFAFAKYTPTAEGFQQNVPNGVDNGRLSQARWTPRDFYDNVHVPLVTPEASAKIECPLTKCTLYPFQTRALRWLLEKEGVEVDAEGDVVPRRIENGDLPKSFKEFIDVNGHRCFASQLYKVVTTDLSLWSDSTRSLRGGILAEEMGLGKTVEMISLISLHQRVMAIDDNIGAHRDLTKSRATLIITPPAILEQWRQELQKHAPSLSILDYTGLESYSKVSQEDTLRTLSEADVVLTTYNVLSREVHRAVDPPRRNMRHAKRFVTPKSPLVRISWWRVCLDEAQMIESGVSNAAQVARLVPRINAWAVTGTPIRKDMRDLFGLLQFLKYEPFCNSVELWTRLFRDFYPAFKATINRLALRHSKDFIRKDLNLPPQNRVVITTPFTAVEEQNYSHLFEQMCDECGVDYTGSPLTADWDPESRSSIEKMRQWLTRLRQTCLHPEVAAANRRALGIRGGPLRSVNEVLAVMIDQNDTSIRAEERLLLLSQARRGQLLENALHRHQALELWQKGLERATEMVNDCREELRAELAKFQTSTDPSVSDAEGSDPDSEKDETDESGKNGRVGAIRMRLRAALEVQHICKFFTANAYYQIKTDTKLTAPDSDEFKALEKSEEEAYDEAKLMRKEMLKDVTRKVRKYIKVINEKTKTNSFIKIPTMNAKLPTLGIEARRLFERLEDFCDALNEHRDKYTELRDAMVKLLRKSLVDEEENGELEGNEYETSTKHQDEMYVYMEGIRVMFADRHDALTGQKNFLINHEAKVGAVEAEKGNGPSPKLYLDLMKTRDKVKPKAELGSLRGIASDMRSLVTSLEWQANEGSSRARAELVIANEALARVGKISSEQGKAIRGLEREVELFRDTMNQRLEYYRQLQQISDTVAPYDEESVGKPLNQEVYQSKLDAEKNIEDKLSSLQSKGKYLVHLRDESGPDETTRVCVICQSTFETGKFIITPRNISKLIFLRSRRPDHLWP
jgi:E3 ubiquitin-protein ligase SHPRH